MLLKHAPIKAVSEATDVLEFIDDAILRQSLRRDLSSADGALNNGEWKAATVLASSLVEALLLWAIGRRPNVEIGNAIAVAASLARSSTPPNSRIGIFPNTSRLRLRWTLFRSRQLLRPSWAKDFRNFIHPSREQRTKMRCDRGTARSSAAAADFVIRELTESQR
jgi:hypothetical protein